MPLYTYVASYKGAIHIAQGRHSNFKGFPTWLKDIPLSTLPELPPVLRKELNPYRGDFEPVPNQKYVWRKTLTVGGSELTVIAVETSD